MKNCTYISNLLIRSNRLSHSAFRVYAVISSYNPSFPSYRVLREVTGMSTATISRTLKEIVSYGLISYSKGSSQGNANEYHRQPESEWKLPSLEIEALQNLKHFNSESPTASVSKEEPLQNLKSKKTNIKIPIQEEGFDFELALAEFKQIPGVQKGSNAESRFKDQVKTENAFNQLIVAIRNYRNFLSWPDNSWRNPKTTFGTFLGSKSSGFYWRDFIQMPNQDTCPTPSAEMDF